MCEKLRNWIRNNESGAKEIAFCTGVSLSFVYMLSSGTKLIPIDKVGIISKITGIRPRDLREDLQEILL